MSIILPANHPSLVSCVWQSIQTSVMHTSVHTIAALALTALGTPLAYPLWAFSCATVCVHLTVKLLLAYNISSVKNFCLTCLRYDRRFPYLRAVALAVALLVAWGLPPLGIVLGCLTGVNNGLLLEMDIHKALHKRAARQMHNNMQGVCEARG